MACSARRGALNIASGYEANSIVMSELDKLGKHMHSLRLESCKQQMPVSLLHRIGSQLFQDIGSVTNGLSVLVDELRWQVAC